MVAGRRDNLSFVGGQVTLDGVKDLKLMTWQQRHVLCQTMSAAKPRLVRTFGLDFVQQLFAAQGFSGDASQDSLANDLGIAIPR
jgi:hypothetical protein